MTPPGASIIIFWQSITSTGRFHSPALYSPFSIVYKIISVEMMIISRISLLIFLLCLSGLSYSTVAGLPSGRRSGVIGNIETFERRAKSIPAQGFFNPYLSGGSLLTVCYHNVINHKM